MVKNSVVENQKTFFCHALAWYDLAMCGKKGLQPFFRKKLLLLCLLCARVNFFRWSEERVFSNAFSPKSWVALCDKGTWRDWPINRRKGIYTKTSSWGRLFCLWKIKDMRKEKRFPLLSMTFFFVRPAISFWLLVFVFLVQLNRRFQAAFEHNSQKSLHYPLRFTWQSYFCKVFLGAYHRENVFTVESQLWFEPISLLLKKPACDDLAL